MSVLHPIRLDRYVLYLDKIVAIKLDDKDTRYYKFMYSDGENVHIPRKWRDRMLSMLPPCFFYYPSYDMWVHDSYIRYLDITSDNKNNRFSLYTSFKMVDGIDHLIEYGTEQEIGLLVESRLTLSRSLK